MSYDVRFGGSATKIVRRIRRQLQSKERWGSAHLQQGRILSR